MARVAWMFPILFLFAYAATAETPVKRAANTTTAKPTPIRPAASSTACPFTACGGAVGGVYNVTGGCAEPQPNTDPTCPAATGVVTPNFFGTIVLNRNGAYRRTISTKGTFTLNIPASCVSGQTCNQVAATINGNGLFTKATCQSSNGGCNCRGNLRASPTVDQGTWSTSGNNLNLLPSGGGLPNESDPYCVKGNTLTVQIMGGATLNAQPAARTGRRQ